MQETSKNGLSRNALVFVLVSTILLVLALLPRFSGFRILDDAYMFARYADNLLESGRLSWDPGGEPVYGATSLLYVIMLAPFRLVAKDNVALSLFLSSFFWGMVYVVLLFRLVLKHLQPPNGFKEYLVGFLFLSLVISMMALPTHFASGMDTTFVMAYLTFFLIRLVRLERDPKWSNALWVIVLGGLAWWVRPDLLVFTMGIPAFLWLFSGKSEGRAKIFASLAGIAVLNGILVLIAAAWVASPLPMSFFAKSTGIYGEGFAKHYRIIPFAELARFGARHWPAFVLIAMGFYFKFRRLRSGYGALEKGVMICSLVFLVYYTFFVLQVMGFSERFYYPLMPFLIFLAARELIDMPESLAKGTGMKFKRLPYTVARTGTVVLGGILLVYGVRLGLRVKKADLKNELAVFDVQQTYKKELWDYWSALDEFSQLPDDMVIATTEVGMPAALNPGKKIVDMAGLNDPYLIRNGLNAENIIEKYQPDLIYMPHPHYEALVASFAEAPGFKNSYSLYPDTLVRAAFGVAVRENSPYASRMEAILKARTAPK